MDGSSRCTLGSQEQHTLSLEGDAWYIKQSTSPTLNTSITFNNKITTTPKILSIEHQTIHKYNSCQRGNKPKYKKKTHMVLTN